MEIRQKLYEMAEKNPPFKPAWKKLFPKWTNIYSKTVLSKKELESLELESEKLIEKMMNCGKTFYSTICRR